MGWLGKLFGRGGVTLPRRIVVRDCAYAMDGGSIYLKATDESGKELGIMLVQRGFPRASPSLNAIPGRLYFGGQLVPMRSELEAEVLRLLSDAEVQAPPPQPQPTRQMAIIGADIEQFFARTPEENCRAFLREIVEFVQSERYITFAVEVERAASSNKT